jgi:hypothetical protein
MITDYPFLVALTLVLIIMLIIYFLTFQPWYRFICYSKKYSEDDIRYNIFNKKYYYCHNDHYGCVWKDELNDIQLKEYNLTHNYQKDKNHVKKIKMKSKDSLLLKILKKCILIILIILIWKIGMIIIDVLPNLIKTKLITI